MNTYLPHETLNVYTDALSLVRRILPLIETWPRYHAICDQMERAGESILTNLAIAARRGRTDKGVYHIECSLGSVLECAACLDLAFLKRLIDEAALKSGKESMQSIARMQFGLRKAWRKVVKEDQEPYGTGTGGYFTHESLDVYQRSLDLCRVLESGILMADNRRSRHAKRIDETATSLVLNIAEGNGRFSMLDHGTFIGLAQNAITQLSVYLDLADTDDAAALETARALLRRIAAMLAKLSGFLHQPDLA